VHPIGRRKEDFGDQRGADHDRTGQEHDKYFLTTNVLHGSPFFECGFDRQKITSVTSAEELIKLTAKRSVFSAEDLIAMQPSPYSPVKMIDFLLAGHSQPLVSLDILVSAGIFTNRPPQSISELSEARWAALKALLRLGFEI